MKYLYKITLKSENGEERFVEVAANDPTHAFELLGDEISADERITNYLCTLLAPNAASKES